MQQIDTIKYAIPAPMDETASSKLVLPTPIAPAMEATDSLHRARYDRVLVNYAPRDFQAAMILAWLVFLLCWFASIFLAWRFL